MCESKKTAPIGAEGMAQYNDKSSKGLKELDPKKGTSQKKEEEVSPVYIEEMIKTQINVVATKIEIQKTHLAYFEKLLDFLAKTKQAVLEVTDEK